jgi:hypothetical protein
VTARFTAEDLPHGVQFLGLLRQDAPRRHGGSVGHGEAIRYDAERLARRVEVDGSDRLRNMAHIMMVSTAPTKREQRPRRRRP